MSQLQISVVFDQPDDKLYYIIGEVLGSSSSVLEYACDYSHVLDYPSIACRLYLDSRLEHGRFGQELFSLLQRIKESVELHGRRILQIILDRENPSSEMLHNRNGIWVSKRQAEVIGLWTFMRESGAEQISSWFFLPFKSEDKDFESCQPTEIRSFASRINGSPNRISLPANLKIRLEEGYRISEYISAAFEESLSSFKGLGGESVLLTTVLQMNDKLQSLINHYSEKLEHSEDLNLYSLSAMNMSLVDKEDETNIAVLVSSGKIILEDIKLGG